MLIIPLFNGIKSKLDIVMGGMSLPPVCRNMHNLMHTRNCSPNDILIPHMIHVEIIMEMKIFKRF